MNQETWQNKLYFGDNIDVLRNEIAEDSVDLIYLDPPFNSNATYNVLFRETSGERSAAQITAFEDTWHWGPEAEAAFYNVVTDGPGRLAELLQALRQFLKQSDMMAYLTMMAHRMGELHRVLKSTGSMYLHCDPTSSHYLKILLDTVFGPTNFRNEVVWKRTTAHGDSRQGARHFGRIDDTILFYTKTNTYTWNQQYTDYEQEYKDRYYKYLDNDGRRYWRDNLTAAKAGGDTRYEWKGKLPPAGRYWAYSKANMERLEREGRIVYSSTGTPMYKRYLDEMPGRPIQDIWDDIRNLGGLGSNRQERLGFPTQKPESLLERIIKTSSNEGDLILDPFCGCGTAISVAERLKRRWIGIDVTHLATTLMRHRLSDSFGKDLSPYEVLGDPKDLTSAQALALQDRYQFEWWALGLAEARPAQDKKKGADRGVDGDIKFFDDNSSKAKSIVLQVKSGSVSVNMVRDLVGVVDREKAQIGVLITLEEPTRPMVQEALAAGFYEPKHFPEVRFPRVQILTTQQLLNGAQIEYPRVAPAATFRRARERSTRSQGVQRELI